MGDHQFLMSSTHFDDEDDLLYVIKEVDVKVILISLAPITKSDLIGRRYDDTREYVEGVINDGGSPREQ